MKFVIILILTLFSLSSGLFAQFSPGELSRAHAGLEGTNNCTQCHEVGNEISGSKCLTCHEVIKKQLETKKGFHFAISSEGCVKCHKEHLGKNSQTYQFSESGFKHEATGFKLTGKHLRLKCQECHTEKNISEERVHESVRTFPHQTYLGLSQSCMSCHRDVHNGRFKNDCSSCHSTDAWKPAPAFNHAATSFGLDGEHAKVACSQCHKTRTANNKSLVEFMTNNFSDCTPCHTTPHGNKFTGKTCKSCHNDKGWRTAMKKSFDHSLTDFSLVGKHTIVKCEQCHLPISKNKSKHSLRLAYKLCTDCHTDKHEGQFSASYNNNCTMCHNETGFIPSLFTDARHAKSRFPLNGAHIATVCSSCHKKEKGTAIQFYFKDITCKSCHNNPHGTAFASVSSTTGCEGCHLTSDWKNTAFDHSTTTFALTGKHNRIPCKKCHVDMDGISASKISGKNIPCTSCHDDTHQGQFTINAQTNCSTCHTPEGWYVLSFNHETQSSFSLEGGHSNVKCLSCHKEEELNGNKFIRFKPVSSACESCHAAGSVYEQ